MSSLSVYSEAGEPLQGPLREFDAIRATLSELGVQFERWQAEAPLGADAAQQDVLRAYAEPVRRLEAQHGFKSVDVVALRADHPERAAMRGKFLAEHRHADFEVRFFVDGRGLFYLHVGGKVYLVLCEQGDLISVPADTTHWFDMGEAPDFKCIRLFTTEEGWVADFTGSGIEGRFPDFDTYLAGLS